MKYCSAPSKRWSAAQLLGPEDAERLEDLRADFVLSAVAARGRRERRPVTLAPVQHHEQRVVLVVGMRRGRA